MAGEIRIPGARPDCRRIARTVKLLDLHLRWPIVGAPMAGGPSRPALTAAVSNAGALGFLAAGYRSPDEMRADIARVRELTARPFGVNLFVPQPAEASGDLQDYLEELTREAMPLGAARWDDDGWLEKIAILQEAHVALVSFTFGLPEGDTIARLHAQGIRCVVTATTPAEARLGAAAGADGLCLQGVDAGGHQGTFVDDLSSDVGWGLLALISAVRHELDTPLIGAGGVMTGRDVAAVVAAGAAAAQLGTALLRSHESGASPLHQAALTEPAMALSETRFTRAFSGRKARGLENGFMRRHPDAPSAYPQINNATRPLRQAALARGDIDRLNLWAGRGHRQAERGSAQQIVTRIGAEYEQTIRLLAREVEQ